MISDKTILMIWVLGVLPLLGVGVIFLKGMMTTNPVGEKIKYFFSSLQEFGEKTRWILQGNVLKIWVSDDVSEQLIFQEALTSPELEFLRARATITMSRRKKGVVLKGYEKYFYDGGV